MESESYLSEVERRFKQVVEKANDYDCSSDFDKIDAVERFKEYKAPHFEKTLTPTESASMKSLVFSAGLRSVDNADFKCLMMVVNAMKDKGLDIVQLKHIIGSPNVCAKFLSMNESQQQEVLDSRGLKLVKVSPAAFSASTVSEMRKNIEKLVRDSSVETVDYKGVSAGKQCFSPVDVMAHVFTVQGGQMRHGKRFDSTFNVWRSKSYGVNAKSELCAPLFNKAKVKYSGKQVVYNTYEFGTKTPVEYRWFDEGAFVPSASLNVLVEMTGKSHHAAGLIKRYELSTCFLDASEVVMENEVTLIKQAMAFLRSKARTYYFEDDLGGLAERYFPDIKCGKGQVPEVVIMRSFKTSAVMFNAKFLIILKPMHIARAFVAYVGAAWATVMQVSGTPISIDMSKIREACLNAAGAAWSCGEYPKYINEVGNRASNFTYHINTSLFEDGGQHDPFPGVENRYCTEKEGEERVNKEEEKDVYSDSADKVRDALESIDPNGLTESTEGNYCSMDICFGNNECCPVCKELQFPLGIFPKYRDSLSEEWKERLKNWGIE